MADRYLGLTISGVTVQLTRFTSYRRAFIGTGETEYSIPGTPLDSGLTYFPKRIWTIGAHVTLEQWQKLYQIFAENDRLRRTQGNYRIACEDRIEQIVSSTGAVAWGNFYVRMFEPVSEWQQNILYPYTINFVLRELDAPL